MTEPAEVIEHVEDAEMKPAVLDADLEPIEGEVLAEEDAAEVRDSLPAVRESNALVARDEISVDDLISQSAKVKQAMAAVMKQDVHYGVIPGTNKPTLYKPGAETLLVLFRLAPHYHSERVFHDDGHLTVTSRVSLQHIPTSLVVSEGEGLCSTREEKYAWRQGERVCPNCQKPTIIKGKQEYGGGWLCFAKKGGCGAKFSDLDNAITDQSTERVMNPQIADSYNTVLKMANKRALVAAVLNGTAASDIFTQDIEDAPVSPPVPRPASKPAHVAADPAPAAQDTTTPRMISKPQQDKLQILKKKLVDAGLFSEDQWRQALVRDFGIDSATLLTSKQAHELIDRLTLAEKKFDEAGAAA